MYSIIESYCENDSDNGLFLVDMPTGSGKTHSVIEYISEACRNKNQKFFFITPLKKNLPVDELKKFFKNNGMLKEFEEKVLRIYSNSDMAMDNYNDELAESIPDDIKKTDEYENFHNQLYALKKYKKIPAFRCMNILKIISGKRQNQPSDECCRIFLQMDFQA